jgi:hypothetical protein
MRALYASFAGPGDLCFDVGANGALSFEYAHEARDRSMLSPDEKQNSYSPRAASRVMQAIALSDGWLSADAQRERLEVLSDSLAWGDVYARLSQPGR